MLSFSNAPGGMLSHVEDVTKERPVGSMVRPLSKLPLFDELRLRTCWPWRRVGSVSRAAAECCAFLRRPDPQITHLLIHRGRGALLQSSSKLSPRGEAPLCNNEFGIQLTKAHLDLWYCRTAREGSYYGVLYNRVLVQHAKLHACARHSFVFLNAFKLFLQTFFLPSSAALRLSFLHLFLLSPWYFISLSLASHWSNYFVRPFLHFLSPGRCIDIQSCHPSYQ